MTIFTFKMNQPYVKLRHTLSGTTAVLLSNAFSVNISFAT